MKKIGEIKGIPVVEGNENEVTRNQIHYKEEGGGIQLSKRGNDNKLNSVTGSSSSSDGGGVEAFQYFKIISNDSNLPNIVQFCKLVEYIADFNGSCMKISRIDDHNLLDVSLTEYLTGPAIAFKVMRGDFSSLEAKSGNYLLFKGDTFKDRIIYTFKDAPEETINQVLQMFDTMIQEITKEEYESMITYKPE